MCRDLRRILLPSLVRWCFATAASFRKDDPFTKMKNPTSVALFECEDPAAIVARKLRDAGFNARVKIRNQAEPGLDDQDPFLSTYRVIVPAIQAARAMSWCREFDAAEGLLAHALCCPECGSLRVMSVANPRAGDGFFCEACHATWKGLPVDALMNHDHTVL
jgi:hypothetical protein